MVRPFLSKDFLAGNAPMEWVRLRDDAFYEKLKIEFIRDGLVDLVAQVRRLGIRSIAIPPLGCGNGGLDWAEVRPLIE